jgi:hypothetical protein
MHCFVKYRFTTLEFRRTNRLGWLPVYDSLRLKSAVLLLSQKKRLLHEHISHPLPGTYCSLLSYYSNCFCMERMIGFEPMTTLLTGKCSNL